MISDLNESLRHQFQWLGEPKFSLWNVYWCMNELPAETVSQLRTVLSECLLQFFSVCLWTCAFLQRHCGVTITVLLLLWCLEQRCTKEKVSLTEEVSKALGLRVGLCIPLTVFNLRHSQAQTHGWLYRLIHIYILSKTHIFPQQQPSHLKT